MESQKVKVPSPITKTILFSLSFAVALNSFAFDIKPERRKNQDLTTPGYLVLPLPYSKPGIGKGFMLLGNIANVAETTADLSAILVTGDAGGTILYGEEIPLISDWLSMEFYYQDINKASINQYTKRGMEASNKNDFKIIEVGLAKQLSTTLVFNNYNKRLNFYYKHNDSEYKLTKIKDHTGTLIQTTNYSSSNKSDSLKFELDYTDDHLDPRNGIRLGVTYQDHKATSTDNPDFYTLDYDIQGYFPFRTNDTLVVNYYQSDAHVNRIGNTDPAAIRAQLDLNCGGDPTCLQTEQELVDSNINERTYGTASSLGGDSRLRAYPQSRYQGAHSAFLGAEYRWNITQEATPFDYFIWKDVRTAIQVALFTSVGTVSETSSKLWKETRYAYGAGLRLITGSGGVYRFDIATGNEGFQTTIIFKYPW